jgi:hypothetical protein
MMRPVKARVRYNGKACVAGIMMVSPPGRELSSPAARELPASIRSSNEHEPIRHPGVEAPRARSTVKQAENRRLAGPEM